MNPNGVADAANENNATTATRAVVATVAGRRYAAWTSVRAF